MEMPVTQTFYPPVLARAHAHQFIQRGDSSTYAPYAVVEPTPSSHFAGQGAYRARMFEQVSVMSR